MRTRLTLRLLVFTALVLSAGSVTAFELGVMFDLTNMDFSDGRESTDTGLPGGSFLWGISAVGSQELSDDLTLELSYASDPILQNLAYTLLTYTDQFFSLRLGPFFGLFNAPGTLVQSGLSTTVSLFVPGIAQIGLRSDNSLSGRLVVAGDYIQEQSELSVGFYLPNVLPTVYLRTRRYTTQTSDGERVDSFTAYGLETDIFQKNIPYRVVLDFAYQAVSKTFVETETTEQSYGSLVLGTEASFSLFDAFRIMLDLESSIYMFGTNALLGEVSADSFLFRLSTGVSYTF